MNPDTKNSIFMCMQCGTCTGVCPESGITPFNIRKIVRKSQLHYDIEKMIPWYCTACGECTLRCPRDVKPSERIIELRAVLVEEGQIPLTIQKALEQVYVHKNPWGRPRAKRDEWIQESGLEIPLMNEAETKRLLFTCCIQAYDTRCMPIPTNVARILIHGGLPFGVLGKEEACCANEVRRMGEEGLFEELKEENNGVFTKYDVEEIIALSPHCMNTLKNEYGNPDIKVFHYTEVLAKMLNEGKLTFKGTYNKKVIYHDPCFLGKQNKIFDEPREILRAIDGLELIEFSGSRENSL